MHARKRRPESVDRFATRVARQLTREMFAGRPRRATDEILRRRWMDTRADRLPILGERGERGGYMLKLSCRPRDFEQLCADYLASDCTSLRQYILVALGLRRNAGDLQEWSRSYRGLR